MTNRTSTALQDPTPEPIPPLGQVEDRRRQPRRRSLSAAAIILLLVVFSLAGASVVYWVVDAPSDAPSTEVQPRSPEEIQDIVRGLVDRGLVPSQTLDATSTSYRDTLEDLVQRGLIPQETLSGEAGN